MDSWSDITDPYDIMSFGDAERAERNALDAARDAEADISPETEYLVSWSIDVPASSPEEAARLAQNVMRQQIAGRSFFPAIFEVTDVDGDTVRVSLDYTGEKAYDPDLEGANHA